MKATSRSPRLRVAVEKKSARSKRAKTLTPLQLADCQALETAKRRANASRHGRNQISDRTFAKAAPEFGGARHRQAWYRYRHGTAAITEINQRVAAHVLGRSVEDIFPSRRQFQEPSFFPVRLRNKIAALDEQDRATLMFLIEGWMSATRAQRDRLLHVARTLFEGRKTGT